MKSLFLLMAAILSLPAFSCSMPFSYSVTCAQVEEIGKKDFEDGTIALAIKSSKAMTQGGLDTSCNWVENKITESGFIPVSILSGKDALELKSELVKAKESGKEVCIFSTDALDRNYFLVTSSKSTVEVKNQGLKKFDKKIRKQIE